jgi:hypothetical protein
MKDNEIPRRIQIDKFCPAEKAIYDAMAAVEDMAADPRLTDAVVLLQQARDKVADFVDRVPRQEHKVQPINSGGVTPSSILGIEMDRLAELEAIVVIGFPKVKNPYLSCSCSMSELALAQVLVLEHLLEVRSGKTPARSY